MKKKSKPVDQDVASIVEETTPAVCDQACQETPVAKVPLLAVDFNNENLNILARKINEVIEKL